jgi:hypothetical protein
MQHREDLADPVTALDRMAQWAVGTYPIGVAPALSRSLQVTGIDEVADDPLGCSLGDADLLGHIA